MRKAVLIKFNKITIGLVVLSFVFSSFFLIPPKNAKAANEVPVNETQIRKKEIKNSVGIWGVKIPLPSWDSLAWIAAKMMIRTITNSTVNWINSGFKGSPAFLTDPGAFFKDVADQTSGVLLEELKLTKLCNPLWLRLILPRPNIFNQRLQCTFSRVAGNVAAFEQNFLSGGWVGWADFYQPQNNIFGTYFEYTDELYNRQRAAYLNYQSELSQGNGFLSIKECAQRDNKLIANCAGLSKEQCDRITCVKWVNTTPGNVIAEQLNLNLGSSIRQLEAADEMNESLAAIFNALINQLIGKGLSSLSKTVLGVGSANWSDTPPTQLEKEASLTDLYNALETEVNYSDAKKSSLDTIDSIISTLNLLKDCNTSIGTTTPAEVDLQITNLINTIRPPIADDYNQSQGLISQGNDYINQISNVTDYTNLNKIINNFQTLLLPLMHTSDDYTAAVNESNSLNAQLTSAQHDYNHCLRELEILNRAANPPIP